MIELYKCEKCGTVFTTYQECSDCENSHLQINWWETDRLYDAQTHEYKQDGRLPIEIEVASCEDWYEHDEETGKWKKRRFIGRYKLIGTECDEIREDATESPN